MILKFLLSLGFCFKKKQKLSYSGYLILIFLQFSGCYSYRTITQEDYIKQKEHGLTKLILKSGKEIIIEKQDDLTVLPDEEKFLIKNTSIDTVFSFSDIGKIKGEQFDLAKTCFGSAWILGGILMILLLISPPINLAG